MMVDLAVELAMVLTVVLAIELVMRQVSVLILLQRIYAEIRIQILRVGQDSRSQLENKRKIPFDR
jgi:hypothetical protein